MFAGGGLDYRHPSHRLFRSHCSFTAIVIEPTIASTQSMIDLFSEDLLRDPYPAYELLRARSPVFHFAPFDLWMIFDYEGVRRRSSITTDSVPTCRTCPVRAIPASGSSSSIRLDTPSYVPSSPRPSPHAWSRIWNRAFANCHVCCSTRRSNADEMDLATDFAVPLPMRVIAELLGVPDSDWPRYKRWSDAILKIANSITRDEEAARTIQEYRAVTAEMRAWLPDLIAERRATSQDDLLKRLVEAEVDGERLTEQEILGFVQLLLVGGQETTANLINNAILCFIEHPDQLARLRAAPELLPGAIEEVLRFRSPLQWMPRATTRDIEMHGQVIPAGKLVLPMIGSANRDSRQFPNASGFDITRDPNPHIAFGLGIHACFGAPLARLEAKIALTDFLGRVKGFALASDEPWEPRKAFGVHGPSRLPIRYKRV